MACISCFNSNMVQLRVTAGTASANPVTTFQFQYGAIKSAPTIRNSTGFTKVSIPIGAIKSGSPDIESLRLEKFQFQYGAIKRYMLINLTWRKRSFNSNMVQLRELHDDLS